jgi:hypothetical protein
MNTEGPSMILTAALMHGLGLHLGAWMARDGAASDCVSPALYTECARTAEMGKLHAVFLAEQITNQENGVERPRRHARYRHYTGVNGRRHRANRPCRYRFDDL